MNISLFIMAAGKGTRFKLPVHKQAVKIAGKPAISRYLERTQRLELPMHIMLNESQPTDVKDLVQSFGISTLWQPTQDGTGGALQACISEIKKQKKLPEFLMVINADMPCIRTETLRYILSCFQKNPSYFQMVTTIFPFETGFGRVSQKEDHIRIKESKECTSEELENGLVNTGIYWFSVPHLIKVINHLSENKQSGEKYITELFSSKCIQKSGSHPRLIHLKEWKDFLGMNTTADLMRAETIIQEQLLEQFANQNIHIKGPGYYDETVRIGQGSTILPNATLTGHTTVGENVTIESNVTLHNATVGNNSHIKSGTTIDSSQVGPHCSIGPHAHLRKDTKIGEHCRIGNFVEMKNTIFGNHSKAAHLAYMGDAEIGNHVNISCGVITCNYDGTSKHKTIIEDNVFVGSDVQLIAPIRIGKGSYIASGSTINQNLEADDFAIARTRQVTKKGRAQKFREKKR